MWEKIVDLIDLIFNIFDGIWASKDDPKGCFGCLFQAISIVAGIISAIILVIMLLCWIF